MKKKSSQVPKADPLSYKERNYRRSMNSDGLVPSQITIQQTDLFILANKDVSAPATDFALQYRNQLENFIHKHPDFLTSLSPLSFDGIAPPVVKAMLEASCIAGVGPMAAVAGVIAEFVGRDLIRKKHTQEVIVENGGDIFMWRNKDCLAAIFAGTSRLSNKIAVTIPQLIMPVGICTSSGTIGHSLSFGLADSVTVLSPSVALADAVATRLGNELKEESDMNHTLEIAQSFPDLSGVVIVKNDQLGIWGDLEIVPLG
ncbi:MAG: UPF0280 family protein [Desulfobulbaceae bacterium]|nr:UPF0280 family protein [Desulfobulbaceae bacterium]